MQKDVKIGIAIGVLVVALIGIYWYVKSTNQPTETPPITGTSQPLPNPGENVQPVGEGTSPTMIGGTGMAPIPVPTTTIPGSVPPGPMLGPDGQPLPPPPPVPARTHTIVKADTLAGISKQYYGTEAKWQLIVEANKDKNLNPRNLKVGTEIVIPPDTGASPTGPGQNTPSAVKTTYKVVAGDTLTSIAKKHNTTVEAIVKANKARISNPNDIAVGTVLDIP